jgi:hypothetical protein
MAISLLDGLIASKERQPGVKMLVSGNLVLRKSVGEPSKDAPLPYPTPGS